MTENPYQSPTATGSTASGDPPPRLGIGAWLGVGFEAISTFVVFLILLAAVFATIVIWPLPHLLSGTAADNLPRWLILCYAAGSILAATVLASYRATWTLSRHRTMAARRTEIDRQRREAIESAKQRHC